MPNHLLWALMILKVYATELVNDSLSGVHRQTFINWAWIFIRAMADLPTVGTTIIRTRYERDIYIYKY